MICKGPEKMANSIVRSSWEIEGIVSLLDTQGIKT